MAVYDLYGYVIFVLKFQKGKAAPTPAGLEGKTRERSERVLPSCPAGARGIGSIGVRSTG